MKTHPLLVLLLSGLLGVAGRPVFANPFAFGSSGPFDFIFQDITAGNDAAGYILNGQSVMSLFVTSNPGGDGIGDVGNPVVNEWNDASDIINNGNGAITNHGGDNNAPTVPCCSVIIDNNIDIPIGGLTDIPDKSTVRAPSLVAFTPRGTSVVPAPPTLALLAAGLAIVGIYRRSAWPLYEPAECTQR